MPRDLGLEALSTVPEEFYPSSSDIKLVASPLAENGRMQSHARLILRHFDGGTFAESSRVGVGEPRNIDSTLSLPKIAIAAPELPPQAPRTPTTYHALQEWEGHVLAVNHETFDVALADVSPGTAAGIITTNLPLSDLTVDERACICPGAIFRWTIGYERTPAGQRKRVSRIVFRQLPKWTKAEIEFAKSNASSRTGAIEWD